MFKEEKVIPQEDPREKELHGRLLELMTSTGLSDEERYQKDDAKDALLKEYQKYYPDRMEWIEAIFGMDRFLRISNNLDDKSKRYSPEREET
jgi:hypothetical protein